MPSGNYTSDYIPFFGTTWAVMSDYDSISSNHCGATAATNIALYYANSGYSNLKKNNSVDDTFIDLHERIGDDLALIIVPYLKDYTTSRGYTMKYSGVGTYTGLKTATPQYRPC